jgi:ABC-type bacteriocin/lantibiotic exporter with double-glycine peptidase domain
MFPVGLHADAPALKALPMPAIVQFRDAARPGAEPHLLVLLAAFEDGVSILDAPYPAHFLSNTDFQKYWTGNVLVFAHDAREAARIREDAARHQTSSWMITGWLGLGSRAGAFTQGGHQFP